jgi:hypothetical protein
MKGGRAALIPDSPKLITIIATISPGRPEPRAIKLGIDVTSKVRTPRMYVLPNNQLISVIECKFSPR